MDKVDRYIERVQRLPPAPAIASQLRDLFRDPNRDTERLAEFIGYDPALTAEVLKRCNSAFFRGAEPASDILQAVSRLGAFEVDKLVGPLVATPAASPARSGDGWDADRFWRHSMVAAMAAGAVAKRAQDPEPQAFTAGLLHDVGKLVFATVEGAAYSEVLRQGGTGGSRLSRAEEAALGVSHAEVGARLLTRWGLPDDIVLAIRQHHQPASPSAPFERLAATIRLANSLAHWLESGEAATPDPANEAADAMTALLLTPPDLPPIVEQVQERLRQVHESLHL